VVEKARERAKAASSTSQITGLIKKPNR